jgi:hypothetical protein
VSKLADETYTFLRKVFPYNIISREYYVNYGNTRLFFDFYIKDLGLLVEVQGQQHFSFNKHFHGDKETFIASKKRDNLKKGYCEKQNFVLIEIRKNSELDRDKFIERVLGEMTL